MCNCSQLPGAWLSAAGTPLLRGRPGGGNRLVVGPAARLAWCAGSGRSHSKGDGPTIDLTQFQPRTPGRSLGGNALSGFSSILASQNGPQRSASPLARGRTVTTAASPAADRTRTPSTRLSWAASPVWGTSVSGFWVASGLVEVSGAGEGPAFGGSLVTFCPPRKSPQLQRVSPRQGNCPGEKFRLYNSETTSC